MTAHEGQVVVITGSSGGLGSALQSEFQAHGWQVIAASRSPSTATEPVVSLRLDVTQPAEIAAAADEVIKRFGRVDAWINNAGITADGLCSQLRDEDWQRVLDVNLRGAFLCARAIVPHMIRRRDGHIINISSYGGRAGAAGQSNYAAAKAGLFGLTQSLARELGSRNVRVNAILPGVLPTAMTASLSAEQLEAFARANVLGRINDLEEVARFTRFLAGTRNISGQLFQLDSRIAPWT
jgi:3-oxoacyl-[acyl-carrier protein] reductase